MYRSTYYTSSGIYKPDIVAQKCDSVKVIDVCVPFDDSGNRLEEAVKGKVEYYGGKADDFKKRFPGNQIDFYGLAVGARGRWTDANNRVCKAVNIRRKLQELLQNIAIEGTIDIVKGADLKRTERRQRIQNIGPLAISRFR